MNDITMLGEIDSLLGIFTLFPAFIAILLAFITKNVYMSLGSGIYSGFIILNIFNWYYLDQFIYHVNDFFKAILVIIAPIFQIPILFVQNLGDPWNAGIVLQVLLIGGFIKLLTYTGGAKILAQKISSKARNKKSSLFTTWILGLIVFFDDYANALIVGPIMRPINDKMKVSREKFAFIIDATAAPIAGIAIISTWIGYELGLIQDGLAQIGVEASSFGIFVASIPFRFYKAHFNQKCGK
jgi:Na+/H+ antiporter NhaC